MLVTGALTTDPKVALMQTIVSITTPSVDKAQ